MSSSTANASRIRFNSESVSLKSIRTSLQKEKDLGGDNKGEGAYCFSQNKGETNKFN